MAKVSTIWVTLKKDVPQNLPQVFSLEDGGTLVYYPKGVSDTSKGMKRVNQQTYKVKSPTGKEIELTNISDFCQTLFGINELNGSGKYASSFSDMFTGKRKKEDIFGWTKVEEPNNVIQISSKQKAA